MRRKRCLRQSDIADRNDGARCLGIEQHLLAKMYTNMPIVDENRKQPYSDTPKPKVFGAVSPFDPQIFATANEAAVSKISQWEVAYWLGSLANRAKDAIAKMPPRETAEYRRWQLDIKILSGLGQFFSEKILSAFNWHEFQRTGSQKRLQVAIRQYSMGRSAWANFAALAKDRYSDDITYGTVRHMRGHWMDRLEDIDADIEDMKKHLGPDGPMPPHAIDYPQATIKHTPPAHFEPGKDLEILAQGEGVIFYRHVNQAERWQMRETEQRERGLVRAIIPAEYTNSKYSLQYYFSVTGKLYPGFGSDLDGTPYYVVRPA